MMYWKHSVASLISRPVNENMLYQRILLDQLFHETLKNLELQNFAYAFIISNDPQL